jgi:hypothetical protein
MEAMPKSEALQRNATFNQLLVNDPGHAAAQQSGEAFD